MGEVCLEDYGQAPEDIPTWCVDYDYTWQTGLQLVGEILLLVILWICVGHIKRGWIRRKKHKQFLADMARQLETLK
jgi:hypothetical protein